jgi:hypothetical protein
MKPLEYVKIETALRFSDQTAESARARRAWLGEPVVHTSFIEELVASPLDLR